MKLRNRLRRRESELLLELLRLRRSLVHWRDELDGPRNTRTDAHELLCNFLMNYLRKGWSQKELAKITGESEQTISRWLKDARAGEVRVRMIPVIASSRYPRPHHRPCPRHVQLFWEHYINSDEPGMIVPA